MSYYYFPEFTSKHDQKLRLFNKKFQISNFFVNKTNTSSYKNEEEKALVLT